MKTFRSKFLKICLPIIGAAVLTAAVSVSLTACSTQNNSSSNNAKSSGSSVSNSNNANIPGSGNVSSTFNAQDNLANGNSSSSSYVFANNKHNNVNMAALANIINYNEIQNMYNILNNPKMKDFMQWLSQQKILVVDGQIPNPAWARVPDVSPGNSAAQIQSMQSNFVICTPQLYPLLYTSPQNKELPGFGMQMAVPTNKENLQTMLSDFKGEIIAHAKGQSEISLFNAMKESATLVIYIYPGTADWITQNLQTAQEAMKPLLAANVQQYYQQAVIPVTLSQGFDSLNSPIGLMYLMQSLLNGNAYQQSASGQWSKNPSQNWVTSFSQAYEVQNPKAANLNEFKAYVDSITPYFQLNQTFGMDLADYGYTKKGQTAVFPFAEDDIHTLDDPTSGGQQNKTLSAYFNDTSMLLALGFTPFYSTYIIDPGVSAVPSIKNGIVLPDYIKSIYPNLIASSVSAAKDGQTVPLTQQVTGIWQHHVEPETSTLVTKDVGTVLADDWLMAKTSVIYSGGSPVINHIIYNSQGDYTLNSESFFTKNNTSAQFNTQNAVDSSISSSGFMPKNWLDLSYNGTSMFDMMVNASTTGIDGEYGNAIMNDFRGFQWFANQLEYIKQNEFQLPKITYYYASKGVLNLKDASDLSFINWNVYPTLLNSSTVNSSNQQPTTTKK